MFVFLTCYIDGKRGKNKKTKQLKKELCVPKFKADSQNIEVERKPDIKKRLGGKSPNVADAVVYWNWVRHGFRVQNFGFAAMSGGYDED